MKPRSKPSSERSGNPLAETRNSNQNRRWATLAMVTIALALTGCASTDRDVTSGSFGKPPVGRFGLGECPYDCWHPSHRNERGSWGHDYGPFALQSGISRSPPTSRLPESQRMLAIYLDMKHRLQHPPP